MNNDKLVSASLDDQTLTIAKDILAENDLKKVKDLTHLFNLNMSKKNAIRVMTMNGLLDKITDQMVTRFEKHPDNFSNADLLNYLQVTQNAMEKASKSLNLVDETPAIQINHNNQVNVNILDGLDRESRERIAAALKAVLSKNDAVEQECLIIESEEPYEHGTETTAE